MKDGVTIRLASSAATDSGTTLTVNELDLTQGGTIILDDSTGDSVGDRNTFTVASIVSGSHGSLTVGRGSLFTVLGSNSTGFELGSGANSFDTVLKGGTVSFRGDGSYATTLKSGSITGSGTVEGKLVLKKDATAAAAAIVVNSGESQAYVDDLTVENGTVTVAGGSAGDAHLTVGTGQTNKLIVKENGVVSVTGQSGGTGRLDITGQFRVMNNNQKVTLSGGGASSRGEISAGYLTLESSSLTVGSYGRLGAGSAGTSSLDASAITVSAHGEAVFQGQLDLVNASNISIQEKGVGAFGALNLRTNSTITVAGDALFQGATTLQDNNSKITVTTTGAADFTGNLTIQAGEVTVFGRASFGAVDVQTGGSLVVDGGYGAFSQAPTTAPGKAVIVTNNGTLDFSTIGGVTVTTGSIQATNGNANILAVGPGGFTADGPSSLSVTGAGTRLYVMEHPDDPVSGGATGNVTVAKAGAIALTSGAILDVSGFTVGSGVSGSLYAGGAQGIVNARTFEVAAGANASGATGVALNVQGNAIIDGTYQAVGANRLMGNTTINEGGVFEVVGQDDAFGSALYVYGTLRSGGSGTATATFGAAASDTPRISLNGGTIAGTTVPLHLKTFGSSNRGVISVSGTGNEMTGTIDATGNAGFDMRVQGDLDLTGAAATVTVNRYTQTGGTVLQAVGTGGQGIVTRDDTAAVVTGIGSRFGANASLNGGLDILDGAVLAGHGTTITASAAIKNRILVDALSKLDLTDGNLAVSRLGGVDLDGAFVLGFDVISRTSHRLALADGSDLHIGDSARFDLGDSFVQALYEGGSFDNTSGLPLHWVVTGEITGNTDVLDSGHIGNVFGSVVLGYKAGASAAQGGGIWLESYTKRDITDYDEVMKQLEKIWGEGVISDGFAANVSEVAQNVVDNSVGAKAIPDDKAGLVNYEIFKAFALGSSGFSYRDEDFSLSGNIDRGILAAYNGHTVAGPSVAAMGASTEVMSSLETKMATDRRTLAAVRETTSSDALASFVLNEKYSNRIWAGGLGLWQDADSRDNFTGHTYNGGGFIAGFDRACGPFLFGGAYSHLTGEYEDASASAHDSTIDHNAFSLYGSYYGRSGGYATLIAGYTHSRNNLREMRGGNWSDQRYSSRTFNVAGKVGFDWQPTRCFTLSPSVGVSHIEYRGDSHDWMYGGLALLTYGKTSRRSTSIPVDLEARYSFLAGCETVVTMRAAGGYAYSFQDDMVDGTITVNGMTGVFPMGMVNRKTGHHQYSLGGGMDIQYRNLDITVSYDYYAKAKYTAHRLMGTVGWSF